VPDAASGAVPARNLGHIELYMQNGQSILCSDDKLGICDMRNGSAFDILATRTWLLERRLTADELASPRTRRASGSLVPSPACEACIDAHLPVPYPLIYLRRLVCQYRRHPASRRKTVICPRIYRYRKVYVVRASAHHNRRHYVLALLATHPRHRPMKGREPRCTQVAAVVTRISR
jgi:hypothetical protein